MKTINLELSKKLEKYLIGIETMQYSDGVHLFYWKTLHHQFNLGTEKRTNYFKVMDLEEAIEFIAKQTKGFIFTYKESKIIKNSFVYAFMEKLKDGSIGICLASGDTYLKSIEEMLEYLLDNNLLKK